MQLAKTRDLAIRVFPMAKRSTLSNFVLQLPLFWVLSWKNQHDLHLEIYHHWDCNNQVHNGWIRLGIHIILKLDQQNRKRKRKKIPAHRAIISFDWFILRHHTKDCKSIDKMCHLFDFFIYYHFNSFLLSHHDILPSFFTPQTSRVSV